MGLYSYSFQSSRGACGHANHHADWRLRSASSRFAARKDRRPKPHGSGAPAARHGSPGAAFAELARKRGGAAELHSGGSTSTGDHAEQAVPPRRAGCRGAGVFAVTTHIRVRSTLLAHGAGSASGAPASRAALAQFASGECECEPVAAACAPQTGFRMPQTQAGAGGEGAARGNQANARKFQRLFPVRGARRHCEKIFGKRERNSFPAN